MRRTCKPDDFKPNIEDIDLLKHAGLPVIHTIKDSHEKVSLMG